MKPDKPVLVSFLALAAAGCVSTPGSVGHPVPAAVPAAAEMKGCYYAGDFYSIGAVKPSMSAAQGDDGEIKMIDDPATAIALKCVMQFDGTRTTFAWIIADRAA
jgi:hypothetical protein